MNKEILRNVEMRAESFNEEERSVEFVISTEARDSYGTVFLMSGWELERYQNNPVVLFNHDAREVDSVVGYSEVRIEDGKLIGKVYFEDAELNPLADKLYRKIKAGTIRGASIRAGVLDARMGDKAKGEDKETLYFTRQELMEWSIVTLNSNPDAVARNQKTIEELREQVKPETETETTEGKKEVRFDVYEAQSIINQNQGK